MDLVWFGHSCFRIKGKETTVIMDPYDTSLGYSPNKLTARIVTISHPHPGHNGVAGVENNPKVINGPGEYEIADVFVVGISTFHDSEKGAVRGKNVAYVIDIDQVRFCHLGDIGHALSSQQAGDLSDIDVLMIPVGGVSTIDGKAAAEITRLLNPKIVIPMHYHNHITTELEPVDNFLKEMGLSEIPPQPKLTITCSNLPSESQVALLSIPGGQSET